MFNLKKRKTNHLRIKNYKKLEETGFELSKLIEYREEKIKHNTSAIEYLQQPLLPVTFFIQYTEHSTWNIRYL